MNFPVVNSHNPGGKNSLLFSRTYNILVYKFYFMDARVVFVPLCILKFPKLGPHVLMLQSICANVSRDEKL